MDALTEFLHMGGYAFYVWTSYAITAAVLVLNVVIPVRQGNAQRRRLRRALSENDSPAQR